MAYKLPSQSIQVCISIATQMWEHVTKCMCTDGDTGPCGGDERPIDASYQAFQLHLQGLERLLRALVADVDCWVAFYTKEVTCRHHTYPTPGGFRLKSLGHHHHPPTDICQSSTCTHLHQSDASSCGVLVVAQANNYLAGDFERQNYQVSECDVKVMRLRMLWVIMHHSNEKSMSKSDAAKISEILQKLQKELNSTPNKKTPP
ncbi:hypothetical protein GQ600_19957 [Phytophthora cactorum]|nr:hypothetical protein GQ600_19957 [Phytophthora cactorum]